MTCTNSKRTVASRPDVEASISALSKQDSIGKAYTSKRSYKGTKVSKWRGTRDAGWRNTPRRPCGRATSYNPLITTSPTSLRPLTRLRLPLHIFILTATLVVLAALVLHCPSSLWLGGRVAVLAIHEFCDKFPDKADDFVAGADIREFRSHVVAHPVDLFGAYVVGAITQDKQDDSYRQDVRSTHAI